MERREFIRKSCLSGLAIASACFILTECKSSSIIETAGEIKMPISLFKNKNTLLVNSKSLAEKIIVVKREVGSYSAFQMKCTHKGAPLNQIGDELVCPLHGSKFDLEGNVIHAPAKVGLKTYLVTVNALDIVINTQS